MKKTDTLSCNMYSQSYICPAFWGNWRSEVFPWTSRSKSRTNFSKEATSLILQRIRALSFKNVATRGNTRSVSSTFFAFATKELKKLLALFVLHDFCKFPNRKRNIFWKVLMLNITSLSFSRLQRSFFARTKCCAASRDDNSYRQIKFESC